MELAGIQQEDQEVCQLITESEIVMEGVQESYSKRKTSSPVSSENKHCKSDYNIDYVSTPITISQSPPINVEEITQSSW